MIEPGERGAIVVAHPDDESLWFAGVPIRHPGDWTIICCTIPRRDPIRAEKFMSAARMLGARGQVLMYTEPDPSDARLPWLDDVVLDFDLVVSHGPAGEYGHLHHNTVGLWAIQAHGGRHWMSRYNDRSEGHEPGTTVVQLTDGEWDQKLRALTCYDHVLPWGGKAMPKWEALLENYGHRFDLRAEPYERVR